MKKLFFILPVFLMLCSVTFALTEQDQNAASFLAQKNIIAPSSDYKLDSTITRREMLKVMMNISGKSIPNTCAGKFKDLPTSDWGCKYAEAAVKNDFIATNIYFRPDALVTYPEALKMILNARGTIKELEESRYCDGLSGCKGNWQLLYHDRAEQYFLLPNESHSSLYPDSTDPILRTDVFIIASRTFNEYQYDAQKYGFARYIDGLSYRVPSFLSTIEPCVYDGDECNYPTDLASYGGILDYDRFQNGIKIILYNKISPDYFYPLREYFVVIEKEDKKILVRFSSYVSSPDEIFEAFEKSMFSFQ